LAGLKAHKSSALHSH